MLLVVLTRFFFVFRFPIFTELINDSMSKEIQAIPFTEPLFPNRTCLLEPALADGVSASGIHNGVMLADLNGNLTPLNFVLLPLAFSSGIGYRINCTFLLYTSYSRSSFDVIDASLRVLHDTQSDGAISSPSTLCERVYGSLMVGSSCLIFLKSIVTS